MPGPRYTPGALRGLRPGIRAPRRGEGPRAPRRSSSLSWAKVTRKPLPTSGGAGKGALAGPPNPRPAARPKGQGRGQTQASGRRGQPARLRATSCGTAPAAAQRLFWVRGPPGRQAPSLVPAPGSQRPPLTPVGPSHSPAAETWSSRSRGGGTSHLGQVRSGDEPGGGGRCSPAQQPGPEGGPKSPALRSSLAPTTVPLSDAMKPRSCNHPPWGQRANRPNQPREFWTWGTCQSFHCPQGHLCWFLPSSPALPPGSLP